MKNRASCSYLSTCQSVPGITISPLQVLFGIEAMVSGAASLHAGRRASARRAVDPWAIRRDLGGMDDKAIRRQTRELADPACEEELGRALAPLVDALERWKVGAATSVEISEVIHEFHEGPSRQLRGTYTALKPAVGALDATGSTISAREGDR